MKNKTKPMKKMNVFFVGFLYTKRVLTKGRRLHGFQDVLIVQNIQTNKTEVVK